MVSTKFDTCVFRSKEKHPPTKVASCGMCPQKQQEDVYKCLKLLIEGVNPKICLSCVFYVKEEEDGGES